MAEIRQFTIQYIDTMGDAGGFSTFHFNTNDSVSVARTRMSQAWGKLAPRISDDFQCRLIGTYQVIEDSTGQIVDEQSVDPFQVDGTAISQRMADQTQLCINTRTNVYVAGRRLRGRTFVPGVVIADNAEGEPGVGIKASADDWLSDMTGGGSFVVLSRQHLTSAAITSGGAMSEWSVQRRRRN